MIDYQLPSISHQLPIKDWELKIKDKINDKKLKEVCQEFEAFFLYYILKEARKTIPKNELFYGGIYEDFFIEMFDEELARHLARANALGVAQIIYKQISGVK